METRIGYLPPNVVEGSISLEAEDGNNNDVKILSFQKAKPDNKYSKLFKPTEKFSIKSLLTSNIGFRFLAPSGAQGVTMCVRSSGSNLSRALKIFIFLGQRAIEHSEST